MCRGRSCGSGFLSLLFAALIHFLLFLVNPLCAACEETGGGQRGVGAEEGQEPRRRPQASQLGPPVRPHAALAAAGTVVSVLTCEGDSGGGSAVPKGKHPVPCPL